MRNLTRTAFILACLVAAGCDGRYSDARVMLDRTMSECDRDTVKVQADTTSETHRFVMTCREAAPGD